MIANFLLFGAVSIFIGGEALNGHIANGRYFLANHGTFTEVSRWVFICSGLHAISVIISFPVGALSWIAIVGRRAPQTPK